RNDSENRDEIRAVVRGAGGQQMVHPCRSRVGSYRNPRLTRSGISQSGRRKTERTRCCEEEVGSQVAPGSLGSHSPVGRASCVYKGAAGWNWSEIGRYNISWPGETSYGQSPILGGAYRHFPIRFRKDNKKRDSPEAL